VRWRHDTRADGVPGQFHGNALVASGAVVVGADSGGRYLYSLDQKTGRVLWKRELGGVESDLVRSGDQVLGVTSAGDLVSVELESGGLRWRFSPEGKSLLPLRGEAPALLRGTIYFGGRDGRVYALEAATGKVLWERDLGCRITTPILWAAGNLFVGGSDGRLYQLDPVTGEVTATASPGGRPFALASAQGMVLVLVEENKLVALDSRLREIWSQATKSPWSTPRMLLLGAEVLAGSENGMLSAFRLKDGAPAGSSSFLDMPRGLTAGKGVLYVGTLSGVLYAVRLR
jgi:outer membrane protein assembly factor BamB